LGGKCASTRANDGSIRNNCLEVWLGFYENAFRMMRDCYDEVATHGWGPNRPSGEALAYGRIEDAFFPEPNVGAGVGRTSNPPRDWAVWSAFLPPAKGLPGEPLDEDSNPFTLASYLLRTFDLLKTLTLSVIRAPNQDPPGQPRPDDRSTSDQILNFGYSINGTASLQLVIERTAKLLRDGSLTGAAAWLQAVTILEVWLQDFNFGLAVADSALSLVEVLAAQTRKLLRDFVGIDPDIRTKTEIIDIVLTIAVGLLRDRVPWSDDGLDSINQYDFRDWLRSHGAMKGSVESFSFVPFLTAVYDLAFAYSGGDKATPKLAAGVALRGLLRALFTYRGSMFWRLRSGMGEAVFAPLYKVLNFADREADDPKLSQVQFHFMHELTGIKFENLSGKRYVTALEFTIAGSRADLDGRSKDALDGFGFWPDSPAHLVANEGSTSTFSEEFDAVILAIGVDDFRVACLDNAPDPKLKAAWKRTCDNVKTIATKSAHAWLGQSVDSLGWYLETGLVTALGLSFDTWVDMTPSLAIASRPAGSPSDARSLAYFCAPVREADLKNLRDEADETLEAFKGHVLGQWSALRTPGQLARAAQQAQQFSEQAIDSVTLARWTALRVEIQPALVDYARTLLSSSSADQDAARKKANSLMVRCAAQQEVRENLDELLKGKIRKVWPAFPKQNPASMPPMLHSQVQANFEGSDRYALSEPGLILHRISPLDRSVENMTVAGDWTASGLDVGCVEAAVMSGLLASHAISKKPALEEIIGYHHP
jgi:uncharacterized protein with NAD-binding domain and iron-sulfur cluster